MGTARGETALPGTCTGDWAFSALFHSCPAPADGLHGGFCGVHSPPGSLCHSTTAKDREVTEPTHSKPSPDGIRKGRPVAAVGHEHWGPAACGKQPAGVSCLMRAGVHLRWVSSCTDRTNLGRRSNSSCSPHQTCRNSARACGQAAFPVESQQLLSRPRPGGSVG